MLGSWRTGGVLKNVSVKSTPRLRWACIPQGAGETSHSPRVFTNKGFQNPDGV